MLNCNEILTETCKNNFKIIEFKVLGHNVLSSKQINKTMRKDKDQTSSSLLP